MTKVAKNKFNTCCMMLMTVLIASIWINPAAASKKVALVIGNSDYTNAAPLKNPKNDAIDVSERLTKLGFEVIGGFDLTKDTMKRKIRDFSRALAGAEVSLFFYAGHAMQVNGKNYLAPIDTDIAFEADLDFETVPMSLIQSQMERNTKTSLIFLDACRDNPLTRSMWAKSRSKGPQGLAESSQSAEGTLIAFSTQPGNVALDGEGRNSPFTKALLDNIERPNVEISSLMTDVRQQVHNDTSKQQLPWSRSSLLGRFYFIPPTTAEKQAETASLQNAAPVAPAPSTNQDQIATMTMQKMAWDSISNSNDADMYEAFIAKYEGSFFADLAKTKLKKIKSGANTQVASLDTKSNGQPQNTVVTPVVVDPNQGRSVGDSSQPAMAPHDIAYQIQVSLKDFGCSPGRPDGKWGRNSNRALDSFSRYSSIALVSFNPSYELMKQLQAFASSGRANGRICPAPVVKKRRASNTRRKSNRKRSNSNVNIQGIAGAIIGGVIACKALRKC